MAQKTQRTQNRYSTKQWKVDVRLGEEHPNTLDSWNNLIELYEAWGKPQKAEQWRAKLPYKQTTGEQ